LRQIITKHLVTNGILYIHELHQKLAIKTILVNPTGVHKVILSIPNYNDKGFFEICKLYIMYTIEII